MLDLRTHSPFQARAELHLDAYKLFIVDCSVSMWVRIYRLGEVTLRDFKAAVDRQGNFRYHFKALDPEFGTVKEEVGERLKL